MTYSDRILNQLPVGVDKFTPEDKEGVVDTGTFTKIVLQLFTEKLDFLLVNFRQIKVERIGNQSIGRSIAINNSQRRKDSVVKNSNLICGGESKRRTPKIDVYTSKSIM